MKLIEIENCKTGYILRGYLNHKNRGHYIIFIEKYDFPDFIGAMITSTDFGEKNKLMLESHFKNKFEDGTNCSVVYNNSHLVIAKLHKYFTMGPFELCGILSESGIQFVNKNVENLDLESWREYLQRTN